MQINKVYGFMFWAAVFMVLLLSLIPLSAPQLSIFNWQDKLHHFLAYGFLCFLAIKGYGDSIALWKIAIVLILFGLGIEVAQSLIDYRFGEAKDLLANTLGILSVIFLNLILRKVSE